VGIISDEVTTMRRLLCGIVPVVAVSACLLTQARLRAQRAAEADAEQVTVAYTAFFDALRAGDAEALRELTDAPVWMLDGLEGKTTAYSMDDFIAEVADGADFRFQPEDLDVQLMGQVASVRAPMMFNTPGQAQPVLTDILFIQRDGVWRLKCAAIGPGPQAEE
jgi:ketosteroid isomerase-like protein